MTSPSLARQWVSVFVLVAIFAAIAYFRPEWLSGETDPLPGNAPPRVGTYDAIDGDSFMLGRTEIRLHGIDAPEYRQTCLAGDGPAVPCGKMARDQLTRLIGKAKPSCRMVERDRYGRQVSECSVGNLSLNREMVRLGWAMAYRKHLGGAQLQDFLAAERDARAAKRGAWQWSFDTPESYRNRNRPVQGGLGGTDFKDE